MLEVTPETQSNVIAIRASGMVSEADLDSCAQQLEAISEQEVPLYALYDWQDLQGWEMGARSVATWFGMHHRATVKRIAIVAEERWDDDVMRISDIYKLSEVRRFGPDKRDAAWEWLTED